MLQPIIKEDGKTKRERYLAKISENTFFALWSYPNVYTDEGITKNKSGKELCDLLVVFENKVLIFSDKDIVFHQNVDIKVAWKRWFKKAIHKSCKQLYGAESWIRKFPNRLFLDSKCKNPFPINIDGDNLEIHLIAVTTNSNTMATKYWGEDSSSTFMQVYPFDEKKCLDNPFVIGNLYPTKTYVHVLDEESLDLLISELNTIYDFINYLEEKEKFIQRGEIFHAAGEEELLTHFFLGRDKINKPASLKYPMKNPDTNGDLILSEGLWLEYQQEEEYEIYCKLKRESLFWDNLISHFSKHILNAEVGLGKDLEFEDHERAIRHLAAENRYARFLLSNAFLEKYEEVPENKRSARLVLSPTKKTRLYVFLFLPRNSDQDYSDYREDRYNYLHAYALVAKYLNPSCMYIVVIATEPKNSSGRSEDVLSVEYDRNFLTNEEEDEAKRLMQEEGVLDQVKQNRFNPLLNDHRNKPYINITRKYGRNQKCPCGSGKKYKKCCL